MIDSCDSRSQTCARNDVTQARWQLSERRYFGFTSARSVLTTGPALAQLQNGWDYFVVTWPKGGPYLDQFCTGSGPELPYVLGQISKMDPGQRPFVFGPALGPLQIRWRSLSSHIMTLTSKDELWVPMVELNNTITLTLLAIGVI